jgi:hypothetical protein
MHRLLLFIALLAGVVGLSTPAWAEPSVHFVEITKDGTATVPAPPECTAGASTVDLVFNEQVHANFTLTTFHITETMTGTFTSHTAGGDVVATGHFVNTSSNQGPGAPKQTFTSVLNANGRTSDGSHLTLHILEHFTVTPDGQVTVGFERVDC